MRAASALVLAIVSLSVCSRPARMAAAEDAAAPAAKKDVQSCLAETGDFVSHGKANSYVIGLENKCAQRLKCVIDANITGAKGSDLVHTVMTLEAKSKKTYTAKVKAAGGTVQVSRDCKVP